jgi:hypothetical protein
MKTAPWGAGATPSIAADAAGRLAGENTAT